jgi:hypothetical protein
MSECEFLIRNNPSLALLSAAAIAGQLDSEVRIDWSFDGCFAFEEAINCLPMYVKRKLDRVALKVRQSQWLGMSPEERATIGRLPTSTEDECEAFRQSVRDLLWGYGTAPLVLAPSTAQAADAPAEVPESVVESARELGVFLSQEKWTQLNATQRYALTKLVDPSKRNKRAKALMEFLGETL